MSGLTLTVRTMHGRPPAGWGPHGRPRGQARQSLAQQDRAVRHPSAHARVVPGLALQPYSQLRATVPIADQPDQVGDAVPGRDRRQSIPAATPLCGATPAHPQTACRTRPVTDAKGRPSVPSRAPLPQKGDNGFPCPRVCRDRQSEKKEGNALGRRSSGAVLGATRTEKDSRKDNRGRAGCPPPQRDPHLAAILPQHDLISSLDAGAALLRTRLGRRSGQAMRRAGKCWPGRACPG